VVEPAGEFPRRFFRVVAEYGDLDLEEAGCCLRLNEPPAQRWSFRRRNFSRSADSLIRAFCRSSGFGRLAGTTLSLDSNCGRSCRHCVSAV